jgi:glycine/D-amino acid oxidase-like deaminating enzyme
VAATFGPLDGSVDPSAVLHGYRRAASRLGAEYVAGEATEVLVTAGAVTGVGLADGTRIDAPTVVNAAGAWCSILAATAGVDLPVIPVARTVYTIETPHDGALPSVFPPSGPYLIPEGGGRFFAGWSRPDDPVGFEFGFSRARFDDVVWPALVAAFPAFEALRLVGGWSGLYEVNTLDGNAILGEWPELEGFYLANGFSGHGFQQCHAVGRHLAELILGLEPSLDLGRFGPERILAGEPYPEHAGRII